MTINLKMPDIRELKPKITVFGVGGAGGNAVNNMIKSGLEGVEFVVANTDAQALSSSRAERIVQMGLQVTEGLGAGSQPEIGRQAAEEVIDEINDYLAGSHMAFITAGMGGGTGTGAAPVVARAARSMGILTVGVVTKPFQFEGGRRMRLAEMGIEELQANVDTLIVIPNQNLFRIANEKTTFADAFAMADQVLYSGVACITDLMVKEGLINLDFADVRSVMREMGKAMMGTGEASGENRATLAAEAAIANPLLDETSMHGAQGLLISITGGNDLTLFEVDEAATRIREEVDPDANIILGATFDESLEGVIRVSVVATGIEHGAAQASRAGSMSQAGQAGSQAGQAGAKGNAASAFMRPATAPAQAAVRPVEETRPVAQPASANADSAGAEPATAAFAQSVDTPRPAAPSQAETAKSDPAVTIAPFTPSAEALQLAQSVQHARGSEELASPTTRAPIEAQPSSPFIPPVAEAPMMVQKMPSVDDFPMIVQEEMRAKATASLEMNHSDERGALGLLKRITHATLGGRKDEDQANMGYPEYVPSHNMPAVAPPMTATMPHPAAPSAEASAFGSAFAKPAQPRVMPAHQPAPSYAPASGTLDQQGRVAPATRPAATDDQLEIPAFLRRQAN